MAESFTIKQDSYDFLQCCSCGVHFLIPSIVNKNAWDNRAPEGKPRPVFYCPNGHILSYTKTEKTEAPPQQISGGNIIKFFKGKKDNDDNKLDPKPAC